MRVAGLWVQWITLKPQRGATFLFSLAGFALGDARVDERLTGGDGHRGSLDAVGFGMRPVRAGLRRRAGDAARPCDLAELEAHRRHDRERDRFLNHQPTDELRDGFEMRDEIAALLRREKAAAGKAHGQAEPCGQR